jgi:hypothetical protein
LSRRYYKHGVHGESALTGRTVGTEGLDEGPSEEIVHDGRIRLGCALYKGGDFQWV